jgi:prohibitin 2
MYTAEELITKREMMKNTFGDILDDRLAVFDIEVIAVSLTNFEFSKAFSDAIEAKVTAEQHALEAKNKLEQIRYEAQQQIIQAEAEKNATIARAEGEARKEVIQAEAEAQKIMLEANPKANAINVITKQMTYEYARYLWLRQWDGVLPSTLLGGADDLGIIINTP